MDLIIPLAGLNEEGRWFEGESDPGLLGIEDESNALRAAGPVRHRLRAALTSGRLVVGGSVEASVQFRCVRCAEFFGARVLDDGFECVCDAPAGVESVDLTPFVREAILLAFPNFPVCSAKCKGLCPRCGANLNAAACGCKPPAASGWGGLDRLGGLK
jgi:uncharacterized protein